MSKAFETHSCSEDQTRKLGHSLASRLAPGTVLCVAGSLGTGKSVLLRSVARALGVTDPMPSPSYSIVHEYLGRVPVLHVDLYRLSGEEEFDLLGIEEAMAAAVTLVEWPDRAPSLQKRASVSVEFFWTGEDCRRIVVT